MKRSSIDRARNVEDKLTFNMDLISSSKLEVRAGQDDRNKNLHPCRFLPAPVCKAKKLWLHAREVLGPAGLPPVSCFDMAAVGLAGYVTSCGWIEIHKPGPPLSPSAYLTLSTWPAGWQPPIVSSSTTTTCLRYGRRMWSPSTSSSSHSSAATKEVQGPDTT
jgi:hypothetical protein